ncbi:hypothetical protein ACTOVL_05905 [Arcanobacterium canis]
MILASRGPVYGTKQDAGAWATGTTRIATVWLCRCVDDGNQTLERLRGCAGMGKLSKDTITRSSTLRNTSPTGGTA